MIKWLISLMTACSLAFTVSACNPDNSPRNMKNTVPEPNPNPPPDLVPNSGIFDLSKRKTRLVLKQFINSII